MDEIRVILPPAMKLRASFSILAGLAVVAFGVARMMDLIDTGHDFKNYPPLGMIVAGLGYILFTFYRLHLWKTKEIQVRKYLDEYNPQTDNK